MDLLTGHGDIITALSQSRVKQALVKHIRITKEFADALSDLSQSRVKQALVKLNDEYGKVQEGVSMSQSRVKQALVKLHQKCKRCNQICLLVAIPR